jgi:AcrR family transcriptional regulator
MTKPSQPPVAVMDYRTIILTAALQLARSIGYQRLTRDGVASAADVGTGTVNKYFGTIGELRSAVVCYAQEVGDLDVLAQGLALRAPELEGLSEDLRRRALKSIPQ